MGKVNKRPLLIGLMLVAVLVTSGCISNQSESKNDLGSCKVCHINKSYYGCGVQFDITLKRCVDFLNDPNISDKGWDWIRND